MIPLFDGVQTSKGQAGETAGNLGFLRGIRTKGDRDTKTAGLP